MTYVSEFLRLLTQPMAAILTALIAAFITWQVATANNRRSKQQIKESISVELTKQRITHYTQLISSLKQASSDALKDLPNDESRRLRIGEIAEVLNDAIYGFVGLLATHETREVLVCARERCRSYARGNLEFRLTHKALWSLHQMLRADLNLRQPGLGGEIAWAHAKKQSSTCEGIRDLMEHITHLDWRADTDRVSR